jgi:hypothetical protein
LNILTPSSLFYKAVLFDNELSRTNPTLHQSFTQGNQPP